MIIGVIKFNGGCYWVITPVFCSLGNTLNKSGNFTFTDKYKINQNIDLCLFINREYLID